MSVLGSGREVPPEFLMAKEGLEKDVVLSLFAREYGNDAKNIMAWLTHRSSLEDPRAKPSEPWMICFEEVWDPITQSRDPDGEKCVHELARIIRDKKGGLFVDPMFPPTNASLFANPSKAGANAKLAQTFRKDQDPFLAGVSGAPSSSKP